MFYSLVTHDGHERADNGYELAEEDLAALIDEETARGGGGGDGVTGEDIVKVADPQPCPLYEDEVLSVAESV